VLQSKNPKVRLTNCFSKKQKRATTFTLPENGSQKLNFLDMKKKNLFWLLVLVLATGTVVSNSGCAIFKPKCDCPKW